MDQSPKSGATVFAFWCPCKAKKKRHPQTATDPFGLMWVGFICRRTFNICLPEETRRFDTKSTSWKGQPIWFCSSWWGSFGRVLVLFCQAWQTPGELFLWAVQRLPGMRTGVSTFRGHPKTGGFPLEFLVKTTKTGGGTLNKGHI